MVVNTDHLESHVRMLSETFRPRDYKHPKNLNLIGDYLQSQFKASGGRVSEQAYKVDGVIFKNIIAKFGLENGPRIIVGAHYDAFGDFPGADDNASGIAGLIELSKLLGQSPLNAPVELVAYTLEEPPFFRTENMGSARHARDLKTLGIPVKAMICLEMIGYFSDERNSQYFPVPEMSSIYPTIGNFITVVGDLESKRLLHQIQSSMEAATSLPVESICAPRSIPGIDFSDHHPYWDAGFPAIMITDTANYRNLAYHSQEDTADRLDYFRMAQVVMGIHAAVIDLSDSRRFQF